MTRNVTVRNLPDVVLLGGGVHAAVVADCIRSCGDARIVGYTDRPGHDSTTMSALGIPLLGTDESLLSGGAGAEPRVAILAIGGIRNVALKRTVVSRCQSVVSRWWTSVHPTAVVSESACIMPGTVVMARAVVNPLAKLGCHAIVNTGSIVEHHCSVGDFATISPAATLCGGVAIGFGAFVGAGAIVITGQRIGVGAIVGAGAVVTADVPDGVVVAGNPARIIGERGMIETSTLDPAVVA